ncbi:MAG: TrkH family potassium uptake protein [Solirubrobacterales bacterium]
MSRTRRTLFAPVVGMAAGGTVLAVGAALLVCGFVGLAEGQDGGTFLACGLVGGLIGSILFSLSSRAEGSGRVIKPVSGLLAVTLAWVVAGLYGAVPFVLTGAIDSPVGAFFEAVSGFTTTGATVIDDVSGQSDAVLLWRSISQWLGGVGIVVLVVVIAPVSGPGLQRAFYAETSGIKSDRLTPKLIDTAKIIAGVYLVLSVVGVVAYAVAGMSLFDAINHSMTTLATGGFSTRTDSMASYGTAIQIVAIFGMLLGGINFAFYWRAVTRRQVGQTLPEIKVFLAIVVVFTAVVAAVLLSGGRDLGFGQGLLDSAFTVVSIITTTGYTTVDFDTWASFDKTLILLMTFIGACAGSTAGGIKVIRIMLLGKAATQEVQKQVHPKAVRVLRIGKTVFSDDIRRSIMGYFTVYVIVYGLGVLAMAAGGLDVISAISAAAATLNVTGPGIGEVGALENYSGLSTFNQLVSCFLMITGRLEVFTVVALLVAVFDRLREFSFSH